MIKLNSQIKGTEKFGSWELPLHSHWTWNKNPHGYWEVLVVAAEDDTHQVPQKQRNLPHWADWWWSQTSPTRQSTLVASPDSPCPQQKHKHHCWGLVTSQDCEEPPCVSNCPQTPTKAQGPWRAFPDPAHPEQSRPLPRNALLTEKKSWVSMVFPFDPYFSQDMTLKQLNI